MWKGKENEGWKVEALKLASEVSGNDLAFIRKMTGENGHMGHGTQSNNWLKKNPATGKNMVCRGDYTGCWREQSYGYCQIHKPSHPGVINDPRFFTDKRWQMEQCYRLFKGGTKFYAKSRPASEFYFINY